MIRRLLKALGADSAAAVAPMVAILGAALIAAAALALDVGLYYSGDRALQSATEAAALSAASAALDLTTARSRAASYLERNGYPSTVIQSIEIGRYCADSTIAAAGRFVPGGGGTCPVNTLVPTNAVRLKTRLSSQKYISAMLGKASPIPDLSATATAAMIDEAGLQMTTGGLNLGSEGLVNQLLTALTGHSIALSAAQLQTLMASNMDVGLFLDRLASRSGHSGTYASLLTSPLTLGAILGAASDAAAGNSALQGALASLLTQAGGSQTVSLAGLIDLGVWEKMPVGNANAPTALRAGINAYQVIAYALQNTGRSAVVPGLNISVLNITGIKLMGSASGPLSRPRFAYGPTGETAAFTAITRIWLNIDAKLSILNLINLNLANIPLVIEVGEGFAQVTNIACGSEATNDSTVRIQARSGLLNAYIGAPPPDVLTQPFRQLTPNDFGSATVVAGLLKVKAAAGPLTGTDFDSTFNRAGGPGVIARPPFDGSQQSRGAALRAGNTSRIPELLSKLGDNLELTPLGLLPVNLGVLTGLLANILTALGVNGLVDNLLAALGIQAGYADIWVSGVRCGVPVLV